MVAEDALETEDLPETVYVAEMPNGFGTVAIRLLGDAVAGISFGGEPTQGGLPEDMGAVVGQLRDYFDGGLTSFDVKTAMPPGFAGEVMEAMSRIPYGETSSYSVIAAAVGRPGAARAVGNVCARNPLPVVVPCHRVVRSNGSIGGFSAGVGMKERLLALESRPASRKPFASAYVRSATTGVTQSSSR